MISDLWELETDDSDPSDRATLSSWGFSGARLSSANQTAETLSLEIAGDADVDDLIAYGQDLTLFRDGEIVFRGRVTESPRQFFPAAESRSLVAKNVWYRLDAVEYLQTWNAHDGTGLSETLSGRYRLGINADGSFQTTGEILAILQTYASAIGISFSWDLASLPDRRCGVIEGNNQSVGAVIRQVLRYHPDAAVVPAYSATGTTLRVIPRTTAGKATFSIEGNDRISGLSIRSLDERQVDGVILTYETTIQEQTVDATVEDLPSVEKQKRLVLAVDKYPAELTPSEQTLRMTLPAPSLSLVSAAAPVIQKQYQDVLTGPLPATGSTGTTAQKWWISKAKLETYGIGVDDVALFAADSAESIAHKLTLAAAPDDARPSTINPAAVPAFRPDSVADLTRELLDGQIAEWMSVKAETVIAEATLAVRKSKVDGLGAEKKAQFLRLGPREGTISGAAAYLLDCKATVTGTDAVTKTYSKVVSINFDNARSQEEADAINQAAYEAAVAEAVIPDLARRLYEDFSVLAYSGSVSISEKEALAQRYLGKFLSLESAARPEWQTMSAQIQTEEVDLSTGETSLKFGPPTHLSVQDRQTLHEVARIAQDRRAAAADAPSDPVSATYSSDPEDPDNQIAQIGPSVLPRQEFSWESGGTSSLSERWDLVPSTTEGEVTLYNPKVTAAGADVSDSLSITNLSFSPVAGSYLVAKITDFTTYAITIEQVATWTGFPDPFEFSGSSPFSKVASRIPLWRFYADDADGRVPVGSVFGEKLIGSDVAKLVAVIARVPSQSVVRAMPYLV